MLFEVKEEGSGTAVTGINPLEVIVTCNGRALMEYQFIERVKYPQPGVYDLHFEAAALPMPKVEVTISTDRHLGTLAGEGPVTP